jgi:hypothetical protein
MPLRLIRVSFSGELAFEVYVPAHHGVAFWEHIPASGTLDIRPVGLEVVASLRIEKNQATNSPGSARLIRTALAMPPRVFIVCCSCGQTASRSSATNR